MKHAISPFITRRFLSFGRFAVLAAWTVLPQAAVAEDGSAVLSAWRTSATDSRPAFRPKEERSAKSVELWENRILANGGEAVSVSAATARAYPAGIPVDADWSVPVDREEESVSVCSFADGNGVKESLAIHRIYDWTEPLWRTSEGRTPTAGSTGETALAFLLESLSLDGTGSDVAGLDGIRTASELSVSVKGIDISVPFEKAWVFFVDDRPGAGWAHPARLVFVKDDLSAFAERFVRFPPVFKVLPTGEELPMHALWPAPEESEPKSLEAVKDAVYQAANEISPNSISYSGNTSRSYYLIFAGGQFPGNNGVRFWADTAAMYSTLTKKYNVPASHIKVYHGYGSGSTPDVNLYGSPKTGTRLVAAPKDLDGNGTADITGAATSSNLQSALSSYASSLTSSDQLFVFITGHGDGTDSSSNYDSMICGFNAAGTDEISDRQLASWSSGIACPVVFAIQNCYSGGMLDDIVATANRIGVSAANHYESSWGGGGPSGAWYDGTTGKTGACNFWGAEFIAALRGCRTANYALYGSYGYPYSDTTMTIDADTDGNSLVSVYEASQWALANDDCALDGSEHPQYRESSSGLGRTFYVLKQTSTPSRPANDDFANAQSISGSSGSASGSNVNATTQTGEPAPTAQSNSGASVWWRWTAPGNGTAVFDTNGSSFDTVLAIYTGSSVSSLSQVTSDDDSGSGNNASRCSFPVTSGTTYRISVRGYSSNTGSISLHWSFTPSASVTTPAAPTGVTASDGTYTDKVLVSWTASSGATSYMVYRATSSSGTKTTLGSTASTSWNDTTATAGTTYYYWVKASNSAGTSGFSSYETGYRASSSSRPSNDDFGSAWSVTGSSGSSTSTTVNATRQTGEPSHCGRTTGSIWWRWTAPSSGTAVFDTNGSSFDTVMAVYTGSSVGSLSEVCSDDDGGSGNNASRCSFAATSGRTYYVAVAGYSSSGTVKLNWSVSGAGTTEASSLAEAVDNDSLTFTTGGGAAWYSQTSVSHYDGDAARSGRISDNGETWLQATGASGPGIITFWWKYSSETSYDWIDFYVDGELRTGWSGDSSGWRQEAFKVGSGSHVFKWVYSKDVSIASGSDCAWIDRITWTPGTALSPVYRFYSPSYRGHFFTMNESEMLDVCDNHNWNFEGVAYFACSTQASGTTGLYRFYSPKFRGHFYTRDYNEYYNVRYHDRNWNYENVAYYIRSSSGYGSSPVYRFWSDRYKHHFYTADYDEYYNLRYNNRNWTYENVAFYAWLSPENYSNGMAVLNAAPFPDGVSGSSESETGGTATDGKRPAGNARDGTAFVRFDAWTLRAEDGTAIAVLGETDLGDVLVETRLDPPDSAEFQTGDEAEIRGETPRIGLSLRLLGAPASQSALLWSAVDGILSEETFDGTMDFELPVDGIWHWLRATDESGTESVSLWLRALTD